jgi:hypothetical protein
MPKRTGLNSKRTGFSMQKAPIKAKFGSKRAIRGLGITTGNTDLGQYPCRAAKNKLHPAGRLDILRAIQIKEANQGNHRDQSRSQNQEELQNCTKRY